MISFFKDELLVKSKIIVAMFTVVVGLSSAQADDLSQCSQSFYGGVYPEFSNK